MTWRLHPEPGSKWFLKGPHWRYCADQSCDLEHVEYEPFKAMCASLEGDPR
jgi:hypothetical protein